MQVQTEFLSAQGANDIDMVVGPQYASPFKLLGVMFERKKSDLIDIYLEVIWRGRIYTVDKVEGTGAISYAFPNTRAPHPVYLDPGARVRFRIDGTADAAEDQSAIVQWTSDLIS